MKHRNVNRKKVDPKNWKRRMLAATSMLLVSVLLLTTSTFAWLVLSVAPEVTGITTNIGSNGSLEIALLDSETYQDLSKIRTPAVGESLETNSTEANYRWGNLIDLSREDFGMDKIVLLPARLNLSAATPNRLKDATSILSVPSYGYDGRVVSVSNSTLTAVYSEDAFNYVNGDPDFGVRAIGTSSEMTPQIAAMTQAKANIKTYTNSAKNAARTAMSKNGDGLFDIILTHTGSDSFTSEHLDTVEAMINGLKSSSNYIRDAIRQGLIVVAASQLAKEDEFETARTAINTLPLTDIAAQLSKLQLNAGFTTWIDEWYEIDNNLNLAGQGITTLRDKAEATYTWEEIRDVLDYVMNIDRAYFNGKPITEIDGGAIAATEKKLQLTPGSGVFADIADFVGTYSTTMKAMSMDVTVEVLNEQNPVYLTALDTAVKDLEAAGGSSVEGAKMALESTYGYALDLAFRTNAAVSDLLLQTTAAQRIYEDSTTTGTMGGGSFMEFSTANTTMSTMEMLRLADAVRVAFLTDSGSILGIAKLNTSNYIATEESIKAPLYLYDYTVDTDGALLMGEREKDDNVLTSLAQNTAKALTVVVWLDGDTIDNTMVPAESETALSGELNLQFASSADLIPADASELKGLTANKSDLETAVETAAEKYEAGQGTYTTKSWAAFVAAYFRATSVVNNADASESLIYSARKSLATATAGLTVVSKDALQQEINAIRETVGKTTDLARIVVEDNGRYAAIDTYTADQMTNNKGLIYRVDFNKNLKDEGNDIQTQKYSTESWQALASTLYEAETLHLDPNATEKEIDDAITALDTSMNALERKVFYIPYEMNNTLYYKAIVASGNTDNYGIWYDSNFKRILNELTMIELQAKGVELNAATINMNSHFEYSSTISINDISVAIDNYYPALKNQEILAIRWSIPSIFKSGATTAQTEEMETLKSWAETYVGDETNILYKTEIQTLLTQANDTELDAWTYETAESWIVTMQRYKGLCVNPTTDVPPADEDPMTFNQRTVLTKSITAAKSVEGYSDETKTDEALVALRTATKAAEEVLNDSDATVATARTSIDDLNAKIEAAGGTKVTEASFIEYVLPVGSELFDVAYGTLAANTHHTAVTVADGAHGEGEVTAVILTKQGVVIKATKSAFVYHKVAGAAIIGPETAPIGGSMVGEGEEAVWDQKIQAGNSTVVKTKLIASLINEVKYLDEEIYSVDWTSSQPDVLKATRGNVDENCNITAVSAGTAKVTATVKTIQGNSYTATIEITVTADPNAQG